MPLPEIAQVSCQQCSINYHFCTMHLHINKKKWKVFNCALCGERYF